MGKKSRHPNFDQLLDLLRAQGFEVAPSSAAAGAALVSKYGVGAVLAPGKETPASVVERPGVVVRGELSRLLDRGYQKFIKTAQYELPATATQLHAIHEFSEELKLLAGAESLYNESLGTTSDVYQYDRLKGREAVHGAGARPWELAGGH